MRSVNKVLQLLVNLMTHDINFNKIIFIDWSKVFIMPKHVFYYLSYATIIFNTIKEMKKMSLTTSNQLNDP
jgi:hypothetical protein